MKKTSYALLLLLLLSGCASQPGTPKQTVAAQEEVYNKDEANVLKELFKISKRGTSRKVEKKLLLNDSVYADKYKNQALIENKSSDYLAKKPLFLEPLFTKVEIMPYETSNGLYHEQQSIWLKVKKGEIVIKSNPNTLNPINSQRTILYK